MMRSIVAVVLCTCALLVAPALAAGQDAETPKSLVETYDALADTILGAKQAEWNLVHAILAGTYSHAEAVAAQAQAKLKAGESATAEIEKLAALVGQLANEGDASVAAIRKRLIDGGHHHHSDSGDESSAYDEGFVIVTRKAKKALLGAATRIAKLGKGATADALAAEWKTVSAEFEKLHAGVAAGH